MQDPALASKGDGGANHDGAGEHPGFPHQSSHMDEDAMTPTLAPRREEGQQRFSYSSDQIVAVRGLLWLPTPILLQGRACSKV